MSAPERVVVDLPLSIYATVAICEGLMAVWPQCEVITDGVPKDKLVIELSGPKVTPDE
jgi:hypothetical protein